MIDTWDVVPHRTALSDVAGRDLVVLTSRPRHVVGLRLSGSGDEINAEGGVIGTMKAPHTGTAQTDGTVGDLLDRLDLKGQVMVVPEVRLPHRPKGTPTVERPWRLFSFILAGAAFFTVLDQPYLWQLWAALCLIAAVAIWWAPSREATVGVSVPLPGGFHLSPKELRAAISNGKRPAGILDEPAAPDPRVARALADDARARVQAIKERYGAALADVSYRIESSALFDVSVPLTRQFTLAMAAWDDEDEVADGARLAELAREVELTFDTARRHAEAVGIGHLPETARDDAARASKAVRLARGAATEGERVAALNQATRLLRGLALYYLPSTAETPELPGVPPRE